MIVRRWWCITHGISAYYQIVKGSDVKVCGVGPCRFPVRRATGLDDYVYDLGDHALDHLLYHTAADAAYGGPRA